MIKSVKTHSRLALGCAAALVTCWSAAPSVVQAQVEIPATADFTLSTNLSVAIENVHLIYGVNASGLQGPNAFSVGSIGVGLQSQTITLEAPTFFEYIFPEQLNWGLIGTYGESGIALAASSGFFDLDSDPVTTWESYFGDFLLKADVREDVVAGEYENGLFDFFGFDFPEGLLFAGLEDATVYNFSEVSANGTASLTIVPEPSSYALLLGMAALGSIVSRRRRDRA